MQDEIKKICESEIADEHKKYNYQPNLTPILDDLKKETKFDQAILNEIVLWKVNRYAEFSRITLQLINQIADDTQLDEEKTRKVLASLLETHGVGLPMASTILRFRNPKVYQIIDKRAYRVLFDNPLPQSKKNNIDTYLKYLSAVRIFCKKKGVNFEEADRILYQFDKVENVNITLNRSVKLKRDKA